MLVLAVALDLVLGDPSPNYPDRWVFKLHPTVLMGKFTKKIEPAFKSPNPKMEKFLGVLLGLTVIAAFALPVFFGLWAIFTYVTIVYLSLFLYAFIGIILLKMTICIKLETDWAKAAAKAIQKNDLDEAKKYSHFSRRDIQNAQRLPNQQRSHRIHGRKPNRLQTLPHDVLCPLRRHRSHRFPSHKHA